MYNRLNRILRVHFGEENRLLCMPNKSYTYLYPHLTIMTSKVTCQKCRAILKKEDPCLGCPLAVCDYNEVVNSCSGEEGK